ncbi:MAG TPA: serine/threonine-protein kinase [Polyangiaceae bacterium]|nr:serine/threonine-protein kinase [Polyangiaceae bacterium]
MSAEHPPSPELERLAAQGAPGGPGLAETLDLLARLRATADEARALDLLLSRDAEARLPEPLLAAVASALVDRGELATAARVLSRATSNAALMMRAELLAAGVPSAGDAGAGSRDLATAVALVERVLLRDIDWPGARERHARWRDELGSAGPPRGARPDVSETLVVDRPDAPYELVRELARGGAGAVYEARDRELGRAVALKVYHRPDRDRAQLLHEARVAVALAGPGVVRVFDVDPGQGWLALEWAALGALRERIRARDVGLLSPLSRWAVPLARTLGRIHAAGWVHLDVKPGNVLLSAGGPVLADFGTARRVGEPSPPGSLGYVSPERLAGRPADPRDDVYGFGRLLEDALDALDAAGGGWRDLAALCTGEAAGRPVSGADLVARAAAVEGAAGAGAG